jgi:uncharacterized membrane protein YeiB
MARFKGSGGSFVRYYIQRSMALVAIGVASFVFILGNPILIRYGSLALLLLPLRQSLRQNDSDRLGMHVSDRSWSGRRATGVA